ncbi:dynein associated protein-domain-containing protein [Dipodascopsis uninucleata]
MEDLKSKIRILERKRVEDRDRLLDMDHLKQEKERLQHVIERLESKIRPMFDSQKELRQKLHDLELEKTQLEHQLNERTEQLEMVTIDREVAEEQVDSLKEELNEVKMRLEEVVLETEILKEENEEFRKDSTVEEQEFINNNRLKSTNSKLQNALLVLHDEKTSTESELRSQIKSLQREIDSLSQLQSNYDSAMTQLRQTQESANNLKAQLDIALGAERLLEDLTLKNIHLNEQIEDMRITIEDLEILKELNDQIESNHMEAERQLQEEIDARDIIIRDQEARIFQIEEANAEYQNLLHMFRELVTTLQNDLEQMRNQKYVTESEAVEISRRTRKMFDLNKQLQSSALNAQVKYIDLEQRRMDVQVATEHLSIVKAYLPDSHGTVKESINCLLLFRRIEFKANMISSLIREHSSHDSTLARSVHMKTELCDNLINISVLALRFCTAIYNSTLREFELFGALQDSVMPIEAYLDSIVDGIRNDNYRESEWLSSADRNLQDLTQIASVKLKRVLGPIANDEGLGMLTCIQCYALTSSSIIQSIVKAVKTELGDEPDGTASNIQEELAISFYRQSDSLNSLYVSLKVVTSKSMQQLEELNELKLSLPFEFLDQLKNIENDLRSLTTYLRDIWYNITRIFNKDRDSYKQLDFKELFDVLHPEMYDDNSCEASSRFFESALDQLKSLTEKLRKFVNIGTESEWFQKYETIRLPWLIKVDEQKQEIAYGNAARVEVVKLEEDIKQLVTELVRKDKEIEEATIKVTLLDTRLQRNSDRLSQINNLEKQLREKDQIEKKLNNTINSLRGQVKSLEGETTHLKSSLKDLESKSINTIHVEERLSISSTREVELFRNEISSLQATVRYLQDKIIESKQARLPYSVNKSLTSSCESTTVPYFIGRRRSATKNSVRPLQKLNLYSSATDIFDSLVTNTLASDLVMVKRDDSLKWQPRHHKAKYIAASQHALYADLSIKAQALSTRAPKLI